MIESKTTRLPHYKKTVSNVDLVIDDRETLFRVADRTKAGKLFLNERLLGTVLRSGFREINLVTASKDGGRLIIPARYNVFIEEALRCEQAVREVFARHHRKLTIGEFAGLMNWYMTMHGFPEVKVFLVNGEMVISTNVGHLTFQKENRAFEDTVTARDFGADNELPRPDLDVPASEMATRSSVAKRAGKLTCNFSFTREVV